MICVMHEGRGPYRGRALSGPGCHLCLGAMAGPSTWRHGWPVTCRAAGRLERLLELLRTISSAGASLGASPVASGEIHGLETLSFCTETAGDSEDVPRAVEDMRAHMHMVGGGVGRFRLSARPQADRTIPFTRGLFYRLLTI